jgi:lactoylglutathione lyase
LKLEYFGIRVTNLEKSIKFYTDSLGLREMKRGKMEHGGVWVLLVDDGSKQQLELNWYPEDSPYNVSYSPGEGLDHIGFQVKDVPRTFRELVSSGAEPAIEPWQEEGQWIGFVKDPDGNWIELLS